MVIEIKEKFINLVNSLFQRTDSPGSRLLEHSLLMILYLFGVVLWVRFLNYGNIPNDRLDWADITFPRLQVIQQAVQQGRLPLYVAEENGLKGVTNLFLSIPDQILTPDVFLLKILSVEDFVIIHLIIFYSLGIWGLLLFKRKYHLSFMAFLPLFLLFNFNGHIVSHLSVGHLTWASYFLFSFFFLFIFEIFDEHPVGWRWIAKISLLGFFIFLSGGYHQFVWIFLFLLILFLSIKNNRRNLLYSIGFFILINIFRILPASFLFGKLEIGFMAGFPSIGEIIDGIYKISSMENAIVFDQSKVDILSWELNFYLSLLGIIFILYFCIGFFKDNKNKEIFKLIIPASIILILSVGNFYKIFFDSGIPLLSGERISSRLIIMTILTFLFTSTLQFQKKLSEMNNRYYKFGLVLGFILLSNDLIQHFSGWSIEKVIEFFPAGIYFPLTLGEGNNCLYSGLLIFGVFVSCVSCIFLVYKANRNG